MKKIILFICFAINYAAVYAQNQCTQSLDKARALYADGHLYEVEDALGSCLKGGFTREQRIQAYHLLTLTNLYLDKHDAAEDTYMNLLKLDPEFDVENDNDNIEIVYLNSKFKTTPIISINVKAGLNLTSPFIIYDYDINEKDPESYTNKYGYHFGGGADLGISKSLRFGAELLYKRTAFEYNSRRFVADPLNLKQVHHWVSLPLSFKFSKQIGEYYPYLIAGYQTDYLLYSKGDFTFSNGTNLEIAAVENPNVNLTPSRRRFVSSAFGGIGVRKRIGYRYIFAEFRYIGGLKNIVDAENRYPLENEYLYDLKAVYEFAYLDDDMRLNSFNITFGYEIPFYKPRKISEQRGLNKIF